MVFLEIQIIFVNKFTVSVILQLLDYDPHHQNTF